MYCNVEFSIYNVTGGDESDWGRLELNGLQCRNMILDVMGQFETKPYGTGQDKIGWTGHNMLIWEATQNNGTCSVKMRQFQMWNDGTGRGGITQ